MLKNTMGKFSYILANVYWVCISLICYQTVLFLPTDGHTANFSKIILWIIVITNVLLGIILNLRKEKPIKSPPLLPVPRQCWIT